MVTVNIWEMDSFSGRSLDEVKEFQTVEDAKEFVKTFNAGNTEKPTPDWYMYAEVCI